MNLLRRRPKVRDGYHRFDMGKMKSWGHNAFWWPETRRGESACIFGRRPQLGDVVIDGEDAYVVVGDVDSPRDPGDQHFVDVKRWGATVDLPAPKPTDDGDYFL